MSANPQGRATLRAQRTVLAVARNGASAFRLLELAKLLDDDDRINLRVTVGPNSRYGHGVEQLLTSKRIRLLPWDFAKASTFDLILSGSANACLGELRGPVLLFPHGAGHHKRPPAGDDGERVFELTAQQLLHNGSVIASKHLLPGRDSMERLRRDCAAAAERAVVAGDPIAQQLRRHTPLRESYRADFDLRPGQRLVVASSTWGPHSLAGQSLDLLKRMVAELPADEYRVAATFHHNVTIHDGRRELERILKSAVDSGLILLPPDMSWQSAVIAADCVIGDHGSTTFYAADVTPVAVVVDEPGESPADSPMTTLINSVAHLDEEQPIQPQIEALITGPQSPAVAAVVDASIERHVDAAAVFRSAMYDLMGLPEPAGSAFLPLEKPRPSRVEITAFLVHPTVVDDDGAFAVTLTRHPAASAPMREGRHLVVRTDDPDPRRAQSAAVLVAVDAGTGLAELLQRFPGCRVAAKPLPSGEVALSVRGGDEFVVDADLDSGADVAALTASAYVALVQAGSSPGAEVTVHCAGRTVELSFSRSSQ